MGYKAEWRAGRAAGSVGGLGSSVYSISQLPVNLDLAYPFGCWTSETSSSTALAAAMGAIPGRVTVHI
jgi:hypothetical protein